jgi:hypothetical protein
MNKSICFFLSILLLVFFQAQAAPVEPNKPLSRMMKTRGCINTYTEFKNVIHQEFLIPKNTTWSQCLVYTGQVDDTGVIINREELSDFDKFSISIITPPYKVNTIEEMYNYHTINVNLSEHKREVISLSEEAGFEPQEPIYAIYSLPPATVDRKVVVFSEQTQNGTAIISLMVHEVASAHQTPSITGAVKN